MTAKLNWTIRDDHFAAQTAHGTYTVGDYGGGRVRIGVPGQASITDKMSVSEALAKAEEVYNQRMTEAVRN